MNPFKPRELPPGPVKWCRFCGRKHAARADCGLVEVERVAKSGCKVMRWALPKPEHKKSHKRAELGSHDRY